jgi:hypothetical protein
LNDQKQKEGGWFWNAIKTLLEGKNEENAVAADSGCSANFGIRAG